MARYRVHYLTAPSSLSDDSLDLKSATDCSGSNLTATVFHTLPTTLSPHSEDHDVVTGSNALRWSITGRAAAGSIHMRFELSQNGSFTDTVLLLDQVVTYGTVAGQTALCMPLTSSPTGFCAYGTQIKSGQPSALTLLPDFVQNVATARGMSWIAAKFAALFYTQLNVADLCSKPPPDPGDIVPGDFTGNFLKMGQAIGALLWPDLCECKTGAPLPVPFPIWTSPQPTGDALPPTFVVTTPGDPNALSAILQRLSEIQAALAQDLELDTLIQRWRLPFGTVFGETHEHLTGEGSVDVSRAVGLLVTVTALPDAVNTWPGNPIYIRNLGWLAVDDGGAMLQELRVARQQHEWYPAQMQLATRISWSLNPDVEIAISVLLVEP